MPRKRVQDWSPSRRGSGPRLKILNDLPVEMVGDGGSPNVFFVSLEGNVLLVSLDFNVAYHFWRLISSKKDRETSLEDRQHGTMASVEPLEEGSDKLIRIDHTDMLYHGDL